MTGDSTHFIRILRCSDGSLYAGSTCIAPTTCRANSFRKTGQLHLAPLRQGE